MPTPARSASTRTTSARASPPPWPGTPDLATSQHHWAVDHGDDVFDVRGVAVPTLVVHGTDDPVFPLPHGEALAAAVPSARLLAVDGMGHQVPPRAAWPTFVAAVLAHTAR